MLFLLLFYSSGIIWEQCKFGARRYKKIEGPKAIQLEEAYQRYQTEKMVSDTVIPPQVKIDDKTEVCFCCNLPLYVIILLENLARSHFLV